MLSRFPMVQVVWTFVVKPEAVEPFERAYGEYARLDAAFGAFTESETEIGVFEGVHT